MTSQTLIESGVAYVSAKVAGRRAGLSADYIGRMCRQGDVDGKLVNGAWYANEASLADLIARKEAQKREHAARNAQRLKEERRCAEELAHRETRRRNPPRTIALATISILIATSASAFAFTSGVNASQLPEFLTSAARQLPRHLATAATSLASQLATDANSQSPTQQHLELAQFTIAGIVADAHTRALASAATSARDLLAYQLRVAFCWRLGCDADRIAATDASTATRAQSHRIAIAALKVPHTAFPQLRLPSRDQLAAVSLSTSATAIADTGASLFNRVTSFVASLFDLSPTGTVYVTVTPAVRPATSSATVAAATPVVAASAPASPARSSPPATTIERVVERVQTLVQDGITEALLDQRLIALERDLSSRMNQHALAGAYQTSRTIDNIAHQLRNTPAGPGITSFDAGLVTGTITNLIDAAAAAIQSLTATELVATNATTTILFVASQISSPNATFGALIATSSLAVAGPADITGDLAVSGTITGGTLSVAGLSSGGAVEASYFTATSASATSTFAGSISALGPAQFSNFSNFFGDTRFGATGTTTIALDGTISTPSVFAQNADLAAATIQNASTTAISSAYASSTSAFFGSLSIGSLSGVLKATAGSIAAAAIDLASDVTGLLGVSRGGTGWATVQAGSLLYGNGSNALATTSAGTNGQVLALSNGVPTWVATSTLATISGTLDVAKGGIGATSFNYGLVLSPGGTNALTNVATSSLGLLSTHVAEGSNLYYQDARVQTYLDTISNEFFFSTTSSDHWRSVTDLFSTSSVTYFLAQNQGLAFSTTSADYLLASYDKGFFFSTTSAEHFLAEADISAFSTTSADYWKSVNDFFSTTSAIHFVHSSTTIPKTYTANTFTLGQTFSGGATTTSLAISSLANTLLFANPGGSVVAIATTSLGLPTFADLSGFASFGYPFPGNATNTLLVFNGGLTTTNGTSSASLFANVLSASTARFGATATSSFSSTGALALGGSLTLSGTVNGPLQANGSVVSATTSIGVRYGGTGLTSGPTFGQILVGTSAGGYALTATSSLGLPTLAYLFPSNATTTALTFSQGLLSLASTTIGNGTQAGGLTINGRATTTGHLTVQGTGTSTFAGGISISGSIVPTADDTYSLGAPDRQWRDVYIGPGSLYINGKKVIEDVSNTITFSTDADQNLMTETTGVGSVTTRATGSGNLSLLSGSGNINITSTSGNLNIGTSGSGQLNLGTVTSGSWQGTAIGDSYLVKTGNWTGTLDGFEAVQLLAGAFSTTSAQYFVQSSTTIPKLYSSNTWTGDNSFSTLTLGSLNGPLHANAGVISATTSIGVLYGGTGLTTAPAFGQILVGNSSGGYTLTATSSLGISGGSGTVGSGTTGQFPYYAANGTTLSATSSLFLATSGNVGIGTISPNHKLTVSGNGSENIAQFEDGPGSIMLRMTSAGTMLSPVLVATANDANRYALCISEMTDLIFADTNRNCGTTASSRRFKEQIEDLPYDLDDVLALEPVSFRYKPGDSADDGKRHIGFIAEDVEKIAPEVIIYDKEGLPHGITYEYMSILAIEGIKGLNLKIEDLATTTPEFPEASFASRFFVSLVARMTTWLADATNGITDLFAKTLHAENITARRVTTNELCVGSICLTETQVAAMLSQFGAAALPLSGDSSASGTGASEPQNPDSNTTENDGSSATSSPSGSNLDLTQTAQPPHENWTPDPPSPDAPADDQPLAPAATNENPAPQEATATSGGL